MWIAKFTHIPHCRAKFRRGNGKVAKLQGIQWLDSSIDSKITSNLNFGSLNLKPYKEGSLSDKHNLEEEEEGWWIYVKASNRCHRTSHLETTATL
jgi:hypothetical protein